MYNRLIWSTICRVSFRRLGHRLVLLVWNCICLSVVRAKRRALFLHMLSNIQQWRENTALVSGNWMMLKGATLETLLDNWPIQLALSQGIECYTIQVIWAQPTEKVSCYWSCTIVVIALWKTLRRQLKCHYDSVLTAKHTRPLCNVNPFALILYSVCFVHTSVWRNNVLCRIFFRLISIATAEPADKNDLELPFRLEVWTPRGSSILSVHSLATTPTATAPPTDRVVRFETHHLPQWRYCQVNTQGSPFKRSSYIFNTNY